MTLLIQIRICIQGHPGCVFEPNSSITLRSSNSWKGHSKNEFYAYKYIKRLGTNACNSRFGHMYACDNGKQRNTFSFRIKLSSLSNVVTCRSCGSMTTALFVSKSGCFRFFWSFGLLANGNAACSACGILRGLKCLGCLSIFCTRHFHQSSYPSKLQNICKKCLEMSKVLHYSLKVKVPGGETRSTKPLNA